MRCPFCSHEDSQVKDSRHTEDIQLLEEGVFAINVVLDSLLLKEFNYEI